MTPKTSALAQNITRRMDELGIESIRQLEDRAGLQRDTVRRLISGRTKMINREKLALLAAALTMTIDELTTHPEEIEFIRIPLLMTKLQKPDRSNDNGLTIEKYVAFPKEITKLLPVAGDVDLAFLRVSGEGVAPDIKAGDMAILNTKDRDLKHDGVFAVVMANSVTARKTTCDGENVVLESDSEDSPPFVVQRKYISRLRVVGRIVGRVGAV